jgi:hypothetical protein
MSRYLVVLGDHSKLVRARNYRFACALAYGDGWTALPRGQSGMRSFVRGAEVACVFLSRG